MDNIERLLNDIKEDKDIWEDRGKPIRFSGNFLQDVADVFEKHGFGVTKTFLLNRAGRSRVEALKLFRIIEKFQKVPEIMTNRGIGRSIIKSLETLKQMEV
ncbi:MAG: hypothetical protein WCE90_06600 [Candidatus Zixiibacteriota bacterium]